MGKLIPFILAIKLSNLVINTCKTKLQKRFSAPFLCRHLVDDRRKRLLYYDVTEGMVF